MIVRHHTFRLAEGVSDDGFLAADRRVQGEVAPFVTGFVRRTTARGDADTWLIETRWWDRAAGDAFASSTHDAVAELQRCIDPASVSVVHYETLD